MPSLSRTKSTPAGKIAYETRIAADNAQSNDSENQIANMTDRPSTWLRAPAPARFVRKQNKAEIKGHPRSSNVADMEIDTLSNISATVEIDADVWTFANNRNSTGRTHTLSTQSKYYLAHRQHVAGELTKVDLAPATLGDSSDELWDGFLRMLSV